MEDEGVVLTAVAVVAATILVLGYVSVSRTQAELFSAQRRLSRLLRRERERAREAANADDGSTTAGRLGGGGVADADGDADGDADTETVLDGEEGEPVVLQEPLFITARRNQLVLGEPGVTLSAPPTESERRYIIPTNTGTPDAMFVLTEGPSLIRGQKTFLDAVFDESIALVSGEFRALLQVATLTGDRIITFPDVGADSDVVMTAGSQLIPGAKTLSSPLKLAAASGQLVFQPGGSGNTVTVSTSTPSTSTTVFLSDPGTTSASLVTSPGSSWTTIDPNMDVVTDVSGVITRAFPTMWKPPYEDTTSWQYINDAPATGPIQIHTVPAGTYAIIMGATSYNGSGVSVTNRLYASADGGTTLLLAGTSSSIGTLAAGAITTNGYIFQPGDTIWIHTTNTTGGADSASQQYVVAGFQWLVANSNIVASVYRGIPLTTTVTVYECPEDTRATGMSNVQPWNLQTAIPRVGNTSGGSITYTFSVERAPPSSDVIIAAILTCANNAVASGSGISALLMPGDKIVVSASAINSSQALSHCIITFAEYPESVLPTDE